MPPPISMNLAMSFARSPVCAEDQSTTPKPRPGSVAAARAKLYAQGLGTPKSEVLIYKGVSDRPLGWKRRKSAKKLTLARENELNVQRWDGRNRMASPWDGLRRDQELWYPNGDCLVHLYAAGSSRRGPAFRIPFECLLRSDCSRLLTYHLSGYSSTASSPSSSSSDDASYFALPVIPQNGRYDLYIPVPPATRTQSMRQHIRTRNFFAWVCEKPLVGESLGQALIDLLCTMREWRSEGSDCLEDMMDYMDEMGYNDMCDAPEHAIAMLVFAECIADELLWAEAFRHVVGMWDACIDCAGYGALSRNTRSLITRAHYSLTLRLHHVSTSMATFLDDQISSSHISLSEANLTHLAHFRDFLHTYWMSVLGYYPPTSTSSTSAFTLSATKYTLGLTEDYTFTKPLLYQMRKQFQALYDYLVNTSFLPQDPSPNQAMGGLCVLQSVQSFDFCYDYTPLTHPLPHLPESKEELKKYRSFSTLVMGKKDKLYVDPRLASLSTLNKASNAGKPELLQSSLVKAFRLFEKQSVFKDAKEREKRGKRSAKGVDQEVEKRKVRWVLVYGIVQTLRTVTEVNEIVKDVDGSVNYFLCSKAPTPPWFVECEAPLPSPLDEQSGTFAVTTLMHTPSNASSDTTYTGATSSTNNSTNTTTAACSPTEQIKIEPDIDHVALSRRNSHATTELMPPHSSHNTVAMKPSSHRSSLSLHLPTSSLSRPRNLRVRTQSLPTSAPIHVSPSSPERMKGTVKRALSSLGNMPKLQQPKPVRPNSAVEILVGGYGNGMLSGEVVVGWEGQEERHELARSSASSSSGGSEYEDAIAGKDAGGDEKEKIEECGWEETSPLSPGHGYEDCLSSSLSESGADAEDVFDAKTEVDSPSTDTSLSRSGSDAEKEKPLPPVPAPAGQQTIKRKPVERRESESVYKELGKRMSNVYVSVQTVGSEESEMDDLKELEELEFGKAREKREMLTLLEALKLDD